jgi:hypothetical protein
MKRQKRIWMGGLAGLVLSPLALAATVHEYRSPGSYSFTVPSGVTSIQVEVAGAGGGAGVGQTVPDGLGYPTWMMGIRTGGSGGAGGRVQATLAVQPGDIITMVVADSGKGGTYHPFYEPLPGAGAGGSGSGSGGTTANARGPDENNGREFTGGGGGGASALSVVGTVIRVGGGGGGGGFFSTQGTNSSAESGASGGSSTVSTQDCQTPANGSDGTWSAWALESQGFFGLGSGGGGGGGYQGQAGQGGVTPGLSRDSFFQVEFAPTGGGGGGTCHWVGAGGRTLSSITADGAGGAGGIADAAPLTPIELPQLAEAPAAINGAAGWIVLTVPDPKPPVDPQPIAPTPVPTLGEWGLVALSSLLAMFGLARSRRRSS